MESENYGYFVTTSKESKESLKKFTDTELENVANLLAENIIKVQIKIMEEYENKSS